MIRIPISKKIVKGKKNSLKSTCEGVIIEADHTVHKYLISYNDPETRKSKTNWFKVGDVTSVTKEEENERQQKAKSNNGKRTTRFRDHKESIDQPAKRWTNNASLLEASINQKLSREKLNSDTINLYFEFLTNTEDIKGGNWGVATSYFYPSLHRPIETSTYSKHVGNNTLWEYEKLMAPVHLPAEHHWLLFVISVVNLCLYIYDSSSCTTKAYRTIFDTIKEKCIRNELHCIFDEGKALFQEDNWGECAPQCPKQRNDTDCGVFTCLFAKWLLFSSGSHCSLTLNEAPRNEMASDLLNLASSLRSENDLPEVFQWMANGKQASDKGESPKSRLDMELGKAGLTYRHPPTSKDGNCLFHAMNDQLIRLGRVSQSATSAM